MFIITIIQTCNLIQNVFVRQQKINKHHRFLSIIAGGTQPNKSFSSPQPFYWNAFVGDPIKHSMCLLYMNKGSIFVKSKEPMKLICGQPWEDANYRQIGVEDRE